MNAPPNVINPTTVYVCASIIFLDVGVVGGCTELCSLLAEKLDNSTIVDAACELLCAYVGIKEFINIIEK